MEDRYPYRYYLCDYLVHFIKNVFIFILAGLGSNTSNSNSACHTLDEIEVTMGTTIEGIKGGSAAEPGVEVEEAYLAPVQRA